MNAKVRQLQRPYKTRWLSSETTVRAKCEILIIWAAQKQLSENKNDALRVVLLRLLKTKNFNMVLSFVKVATLSKVFQARCLTCTDESFRRTVHQQTL